MRKTKKLSRLLSGTTALALLATLSMQLIPLQLVHAATQITNRSLTLEPGTAGDGGSWSGGTVKHLFTFGLHDSTDLVGSMTFQYCTTAAAVPNGVDCIAPAGINVSGATLTQDNGASGFTTVTPSSIDDAGDGVVNTLTIGRGSAAALVLTDTCTNSDGSTSSCLVTTKEFSGIVNPSTPMTFFVRISTYSSTDGSGTALESGTVAAATTTKIDLSGTMPESLVFCTGHTIDINGSGVPDCTTASSGAVSFNQLFSPSSTSWAYSQMAASTNAGFGYVITVTGPTLTSGSNTITAIGATADISRVDTRQFGLNLIDDSTPPSPLVTDPTIGSASTNPITYYNGDSAGTGGAINPASDGSSYMAAAASGFDGLGDPTSSNLPTYSFTADTPNIVAKSDNGTGTSGPTNTQRYTATYIVNVSGNLPAGSYTSTLTYICTPTF